MLARNLYKWAKGNETRIAQLETWRDEAIAAIAEGKCKEVISTSGNGLSVTFANGSTLQTWFDALSLALDLLSAGGIHRHSQIILV